MRRQRRHKVFVSYHHENDQGSRNRFERLFGDVYDIMDSRSVNIGAIPNGLPLDEISRRIRDNYLSDSTVTVVLIGKDTWRRKHVDWEIAATVRDTDANPRSGLLGILLPTYASCNGEDLRPVHDSTTTPLQRGMWLCRFVLLERIVRRRCGLGGQGLQAQKHNNSG